EFVNELMKGKDTPVAQTTAWREATESLALMLAPFTPHLAEELWNRLGKPFSVHNQSWPAWDEALAAAETVEVAVQVNGKVRDRIDLPAASSDTDALAAARASAKVQEYLTGKQIVKEIYVPGRLISFVVR
ncbi:MAG: class I tRNA ligase family protein, partial [Chloroflexota bacterium]|nr:class I tRNA ligase family protein [Chloroflexota bacterium]